MSKLIIKVNDYYVFRDHEDNLHIPEEMMKELKAKMNYEEAIMCFMDSLLDLENKENIIKHVIDYITTKVEELKENHMYIIFEKEDIYEVLNILRGEDNE